jgi:hypothetical protein
VCVCARAEVAGLSMRTPAGVFPLLQLQRVSNEGRPSGRKQSAVFFFGGSNEGRS